MNESSTQNSLISPLRELNSFSSLLACLKEAKSPVLTTGIMDSAKCHLAYAVSESFSSPSFIVSYSEFTAKQIYDDMKFFNKDNTVYYPSKDMIFYSADVYSAELTKQRLRVINGLIDGSVQSVILSSEALLDKLTPPAKFKDHITNLSVGDEISLDELAKKLVVTGYERRDSVEGPGQFAIRGGIIDIFTPIYNHAVRVELWGDEVDSIRLIDAFTQRSVDKIESVSISPMIEFISEGDSSESEGATILDYLPQNAILFFDEPNKITEHMETIELEFSENIKSRLLRGFKNEDQEKDGILNAIFPYEHILSQISKFKTVLFASLASSIKGFPVKDIVNFDVKMTGVFKSQIELLSEDLSFWQSNGYRIIILAGSETRGKRISGELFDRGLNAAYYENIDTESIKKGHISVTHGSLNKGFEYRHINFLVLTDKEIFGENKKRKPLKKKKGLKIESFTDLKVGDYVVHDNHGIAVYKGIKQIVTDSISRDYLTLQYADAGVLYIHTSQMDMIQKYIGSESAKIKLNKLGGGEWARAKTRTREAVKILASELIALYAERQAAKGHQFSQDTVWQKEFEDMFQFEETDDQIEAIEDVKKDMESVKVMDRLICGDVGYGKTEVAIRAAFKAVQDGKQVAFLVPTTILAQQHYNTFAQRMKDFPIVIEMLSRFRTKKEQTESLDRISNGLSDIVIGTHRILSKDMNFANLGLIVVDEEQRFGVSHKEKLKHMKKNVDVLTLTATPIPRTLHMSMTGIRDMSVLEEPPNERRPIQTYVIEHSQEVVRDAILREISRGGQVYYLNNRVRNISDIAVKLQELVPEAVISYAHGQMSERELETVMMDFIDGNIDVLVCTTIIETGLDISNVNTIIVQDSDRMGLSQLYQLRGRVGRSNRLAYAYLMYRKDKILDEVAEKRLQTIRDFTEFGAGFKIAMRDLEIRGAGNLLGGEQHGHMDIVGYDMYCKLLAEAVSDLNQDEEKEAAFETTIDVNVNAFIPSFYIFNEEQKLEIYKKISLITETEDYFDVQEEIEDRFGTIPVSVQMLLEIALLKAFAHKCGIINIAQKNGSLVISFKADAKVQVDNILKAIDQSGGKMRLVAKGTPQLIYNLNEGENIDFWRVKELFEVIIG
ncbi:MAG: transcription-repair coupling factor [Defluviitaleaceae bacterium]|nr:transcription-repair coupling factor [Defluviitaleaceae bacterium]